MGFTRFIVNYFPALLVSKINQHTVMRQSVLFTRQDFRARDERLSAFHYSRHSPR